MFHISDIEHFGGECDRDGETFKKLEELAQDYRNLGSRIEGVLAKAEGLVMALHKERFIKANEDSIQAAPKQVIISQPVATTTISKPNPHKGAHPPPQSPNHQSKSSACQNKLIEKINLQLKETSTLREKLKELDLKVADSKNLKKEITLKDKAISEIKETNENLKIQIDKLLREKSEQNETIKELNEVIQKLQFKDNPLTNKVQAKSSAVPCPNVNKDNIPEFLKKGDLIRNIGDIANQKFKNEDVLKSNIEEIMLEISNEKRKAAEHRNAINDKINSIGLTLESKMRKKLNKYRGERSSQIAEFETNIKRKFGNILRSINDEDLRYVENRLRTNKDNMNQSIKKLEDHQAEINKEIFKDILEIKEQNAEMRILVKNKENEIQTLRNLVKDLPSDDGLTHIGSPGLQVITTAPQAPELFSKGVKVHQNPLSTRVKDNLSACDCLIQRKDNVLLHDKDPHPRSNWGNNIRISNKFGCLRNELLYENRAFKES